MIGPHGTGHLVARDGRLLRIDREWVGNRWVATRFGPHLVVHDVFYGSQEEVRAVVRHWMIHG